MDKGSSLLTPDDRPEDFDGHERPSEDASLAAETEEIARKIREIVSIAKSAPSTPAPESDDGILEDTDVLTARNAAYFEGVKAERETKLAVIGARVMENTEHRVVFIVGSYYCEVRHEPHFLQYESKVPGLKIRAVDDAGEILAERAGNSFRTQPKSKEVAELVRRIDICLA